MARPRQKRDMSLEEYEALSAARSRQEGDTDPQADAVARFPALLETLEDTEFLTPSPRTL